MGRTTYHTLFRVVSFLAIITITLQAGKSSELSLHPLPRYSEFSLRRFAVSAPKPEYPATSVSRGSTGVAVLLLEIGKGGSPTLVKVLQAPDDAIAQSLSKTVGQWRFRSNGPSQYSGKLTFYYRKSGGIYEVIGGDE
jgi:hypothetical protein